jgi:hypothetical protein
MLICNVRSRRHIRGSCVLTRTKCIVLTRTKVYRIAENKVSDDVPTSLLRLKPKCLIYYKSTANATEYFSPTRPILTRMVEVGLAATVEELHIQNYCASTFASLSGFVALRRLYLNVPTFECQHYTALSNALGAMPNLLFFSGPSALLLDYLVPYMSRTVQHIRTEGAYAAMMSEIVDLCRLPLVALETDVTLNAYNIALLARELPQLHTVRFAWNKRLSDNTAKVPELLQLPAEFKNVPQNGLPSLTVFGHLTALTLRTNQPDDVAILLSSLTPKLIALTLSEYETSTDEGDRSGQTVDGRGSDDVIYVSVSFGARLFHISLIRSTTENDAVSF